MTDPVHESLEGAGREVTRLTSDSLDEELIAVMDNHLVFLYQVFTGDLLDDPPEIAFDARWDNQP